jgi:CRISPR-associated protein Csx14
LLKAMKNQVIIATLGSEPQVVTLALDLLEAKGYAINAVIVVHTAGKIIQPALARLRQEFDRPAAPAYKPLLIQGKEGPVTDIVTEADTSALLRTLYQAVLTQKRADRIVHMSIAGGRKTMAVYGMVVAQLLFDDDDRLWHLLSRGWRPGDERVMHVRPGAPVSLVPIPVLRWSSISPVATELALREDPWDALQAQRRIRQTEDQRRKREVVRLASQGLDNAAIAERLQKAEKTVANQLTGVYGKLHEWRGYRTDVPVSRAVLVAEFATYFALERR